MYTLSEIAKNLEYLTAGFESLIIGLPAPMVTGVFIAVIGIAFCTALIGAYLGIARRFVDHAPTLLTSLGILGTFTGIVIGLLHFEATKIDESIPLLLDGLKTAFITSVLGMASAVVFDFLDTTLFEQKRKQDVTKRDVSPKDIHSVLEQQKEILTEVSLGLTGNEEGSLVGQLKLMRGDQSDNARQSKERMEQLSTTLWEKLDQFAEMLSETATKHIIEALQEVVRDFNNNLIETFGDNFKALDASVKKMVDWQEEYKNQVEVMSEQYAQSVASLVQTKEAVGGIWDECKEIPLAMAELKEVLLVNQHQINELRRHLEAFLKMRDAAVTAVPTIQSKIEEIGQQLLSGANEMKVALDEGAEHFRDSVKVTNASVGEMSNVVKSTSESLSVTLKDTSTEIANNSRDMLTRMSESVKGVQEDLTRTTRALEDHARTTVSGVEQSSAQMLQLLQNHTSQATASIDEHLRRAVGQTGDVVNEQLRQLETATAREIEKSMNEMGRSLLKITERFVSDYQIMITRMDKIVKLSDRLDN